MTTTHPDWEADLAWLESTKHTFGIRDAKYKARVDRILSLARSAQALRRAVGDLIAELMVHEVILARTSRDDTPISLAAQAAAEFDRVTEGKT